MAFLSVSEKSCCILPTKQEPRGLLGTGQGPALRCARPRWPFPCYPTLSSAPRSRQMASSLSLWEGNGGSEEPGNLSTLTQPGSGAVGTRVALDPGPEVYLGNWYPSPSLKLGYTWGWKAPIREAEWKAQPTEKLGQQPSTLQTEFFRGLGPQRSCRGVNQRLGAGDSGCGGDPRAGRGGPRQSWGSGHFLLRLRLDQQIWASFPRSPIAGVLTPHPRAEWLRVTTS